MLVSTMQDDVDDREPMSREVRRMPRYNLDVLVAGIKDENCHRCIDMGPPSGNEAW